MDNIWLLTEERPKPSVVLKIIKTYCLDFGDRFTETGEIKIKPRIERGIFKFVYEVEGIALENAEKIYIKIVIGSSSFLDFLLFKREKPPKEDGDREGLLMAIEETKTKDNESRNTGVYQRGAKDVYKRQPQHYPGACYLRHCICANEEVHNG